MDQKDVSLELLVRSGNPKGVDQFAESEGFDEERKFEKITEAGIYSAIKCMQEQADVCIDSENICQFLNQERFTDYFSKTDNTEVLEGIVDVLRAGSEAMMEANARITAFDVLGIESLADAIRRNINESNMMKKVTGLVRRGYSLVFCPHDISEEMVDHYFPIIDEWRDLVNPHEIAQSVIYNFAEIEDLSKNNVKRNFVYKSLDKLIELTDRETVSRLVYENFVGSDEYQRFIDEGKVDDHTATEESENENLNIALKEYEGKIIPSNHDVRELAEYVGDDDKEYMARVIGKWFRKGRMIHFLQVANYEEDIYDHDVARKIIGESIAEASDSGDLNFLGWVLDLPKHLIDETNPDIKGVVTAYKISQQTRYQE